MTSCCVPALHLSLLVALVCSAVIDLRTCDFRMAAIALLVCHRKVGLMESIAIAKSLADMHRHELDPSQELLGERRRPAACYCAACFGPT